jgi:uncharacterized protein YkwD/uncharacterized protein YraI
MTRGSLWRWLVAALLIVPALALSFRTTMALPVSPVLLTTTSGYCADAEENAFLQLINQYRAANGLGQLTHTQTLAAAAEHHSVDMAAKNYFSHTMLDGTSVPQNIANHGYSDGSTWGENIAAGNANAAATFEQWRKSPGHNANMLNPSFGAIGIGRAYGAGSTYGTYWTTVFGATSDGAAAVCGAAPVVPPTEPAPTTPPASGIDANAATTTDLNLRDAPNLGAVVLTVMPDGARVAVTGASQAGFVPVTYGGFSGWAWSEYLIIDGQSAPAPSAPNGPSQGTMTVTESLNLRSGPNTTSTVLTVMPAGANVDITGGSQQGFLPVTYNGLSGWAYSQYLTTGGAATPPPPAPSGSGSATVSTDLNLRSGPGLDRSVLLVMPVGAQVTLTGGNENGFLAVRYGSTEGWAWAGYLTTGGGSAPVGASRTVTTDLNLRSGPSLSDAVILVMPPGAVVEATGTARNGFLPVTYNGTSGWAYAAYLA